MNKARVAWLIQTIINKAPPCPDPAGGGCIGGRCIYCAARELIAYTEVEKEIRELPAILE